DLRPARPERRGQVDDVQDALRPVASDVGARRGRRNRSRARGRRREAARRLHGAEILAVRALVGASEPQVLRRYLRHRRRFAPPAHRRDGRDVRARPFSEQLAERAAARLQATSRARLRADAPARGAVPRRADLGRRSDHAARVLDAHQRSRPQGRHGAGHDPLHGRGGVLRPRRDDPSGAPHRACAAGRAQGRGGERGESRADDGGRVHRDDRVARGRRGASRMTSRRRFNAARLLAIVRKESFQIVRDPSNLLIAFVLPVVLLFLFAFAVSLDIDEVAVGVVVENQGAASAELGAAFAATRYFDTRFARDRRELEPLVVAGELRGLVVIPQDFDAALERGTPARLQVLTDGAAPNTAGFVANYARGVAEAWWSSQRAEAGVDEERGPSVRVEP